jgi:molecular chaperone DnaK (HSP70)
VAQHFQRLLRDHGAFPKQWSEDAINSITRTAERIRIHLSNSKAVNLALPLSENSWTNLTEPNIVILPNQQDPALPEEGLSNSSHVLCLLTRKSMEKLCREELQALLRPIREVAIMSGALLPGDTSPTLVENALEMEEEDQASFAFEEFYQEGKSPNTKEVDPDNLLELHEFDMRAAKKAQQRGRKRARNVAKDERKYRTEKRRLGDSVSTDGMKVRDGISGRPISRVVLVGGATRMPAIGRLLGALTGVVPQKTVNPDEAVALGCAVHVGVLDGLEGMGSVLNPIQAAILRAVAEQQGLLNSDIDFDEGFTEAEYF